MISHQSNETLFTVLPSLFLIKFINLHHYQFSSHHIEIKGFSTIITCCVCVLMGESEPPTSISQIKYFLHFPFFHISSSLLLISLLFINNHLRQLIHTFNIFPSLFRRKRGGLYITLRRVLFFSCVCMDFPELWKMSNFFTLTESTHTLNKFSIVWAVCHIIMSQSRLCGQGDLCQHLKKGQDEKKDKKVSIQNLFGFSLSHSICLSDFYLFLLNSFHIRKG